MVLLRKPTVNEPNAFEIEPLTPEIAGRIRPSIFARFSSADLAWRAQANPGLCFVVRGQSHYALGGTWRSRAEIGEVVEVSRGPYRRPLLRRLLGAFAEAGAALVVLDFEEGGNDLSFYSQEGFGPIERIVEYDRRGCSVDQSAPSLPIRPYRSSDLDAVLEIERESFPWLWWNSEAELRHYHATPGVEIWLSLVDGQPVGYAGFTVRGSAGHLDRLAVRRPHQRRGHGAALLVHVLSRMASLGVRRVTLSTQADNSRSQALYERFGFHRSRWSYDIHGLWLRDPQEARS